MKVKINSKSYDVPELTFRHYTKMEEQGFSIIDAFQKKQLLLIAMGFTCAVTGFDRAEAEELLEQHVLGGGNITDIVSAFGEAIGESDFFQKMLGIQEEEKKPVKKTAKVTPISKPEQESE
jgi:hypothetical protein